MNDPKFATLAAEQLVKDLNLNSLPIKPVQIALDHDILVKEMPASSPGGVSGCLLYAHGNFAILYATHIDNDGFQRFSIGHELGHYFLPGHFEALVQGGIHESVAGSASGDHYEKEADHFSSGLLMPKQLFDPALRNVGEGLGAIKSLGELCETSNTATAIRYTQRTREIAAIVVSEGDRICYAHMSDELKEYPGVQWIKKNTPLPTSLTKRFNADPQNVVKSREEEGATEFSDWFGDRVEGELTEEVIGLGRYGRTLTVLTASDVPDPEELEEEADLEESWAVKFRR